MNHHQVKTAQNHSSTNVQWQLRVAGSGLMGAGWGNGSYLCKAWQFYSACCKEDEINVGFEVESAGHSREVLMAEMKETSFLFMSRQMCARHTRSLNDDALRWHR